MKMNIIYVQIDYDTVKYNYRFIVSVFVWSLIMTFRAESRSVLLTSIIL